MKITKSQLKRLIREAIRKRIDLPKEHCSTKSESNYHFAKHDYEKTIINKNVSKLVKDLSYEMDWSKEDQEEIYSDLQNMISNYLRQSSK